MDNELKYAELVIKQQAEEISKLKSLLQVYRYDHLTGFPLRRDYEYTLDGLWYELETFDHKFLYAMLDINGLKKINTDKGYGYGNILITSVTDQIKIHFEDSEIFRIGGDEFVILKRGSDFKSFEERLNLISDIEFGVIEITTGLFEDINKASVAVDTLVRAKKRDNKRRSTDI